jgi:hypothetical protein
MAIIRTSLAVVLTNLAPLPRLLASAGAARAARRRPRP